MSETRSHDYPNPNTHVHDGPSPELAPTESSQGVKGHNVRFILAIGTVGAVVAVALAYVFFFAA